MNIFLILPNLISCLISSYLTLDITVGHLLHNKTPRWTIPITAPVQWIKLFRSFQHCFSYFYYFLFVYFILFYFIYTDTINSLSMLTLTFVPILLAPCSCSCSCSVRTIFFALPELCILVKQRDVLVQMRKLHFKVADARNCS